MPKEISPRIQHVYKNSHIFCHIFLFLQRQNLLYQWQVIYQWETNPQSDNDLGHYQEWKVKQIKNCLTNESIEFPGKSNVQSKLRTTALESEAYKVLKKAGPKKNDHLLSFQGYPLGISTGQTCEGINSSRVACELADWFFEDPFLHVPALSLKAGQKHWRQRCYHPTNSFYSDVARQKHRGRKVALEYISNPIYGGYSLNSLFSLPNNLKASILDLQVKAFRSA